VLFTTEVALWNTMPARAEGCVRRAKAEIESRRRREIIIARNPREGTGTMLIRKHVDGLIAREHRSPIGDIAIATGETSRRELNEVIMVP
jgi:hypothetical protein